MRSGGRVVPSFPRTMNKFNRSVLLDMSNFTSNLTVSSHCSLELGQLDPVAIHSPDGGQRKARGSLVRKEGVTRPSAVVVSILPS